MYKGNVALLSTVIRSCSWKEKNKHGRELNIISFGKVVCICVCTEGGKECVCVCVCVCDVCVCVCMCVMCVYVCACVCVCVVCVLGRGWMGRKNRENTHLILYQIQMNNPGILLDLKSFFAVKCRNP